MEPRLLNRRVQTAEFSSCKRFAWTRLPLFSD